jgi:hypothetical protein
MRPALLIVGLVCCLIGLELVIVDQVVLHGFSDSRNVDEADEEQDASSQAAPRLIDLPDSAGYALLAVGIASLMYSLALRRSRERK